MTETNVKGLELLKEMIPSPSRVAILYEPATPSHGPGLDAAKEAGQPCACIFKPSQRHPQQSSSARMGKEGAQAVLVLSTPLFIAGAKPLAELGLKYITATLETVFVSRTSSNSHANFAIPARLREAIANARAASVPRFARLSFAAAAKRCAPHRVRWHRYGHGGVPCPTECL